LINLLVLGLSSSTLEEIFCADETLPWPCIFQECGAETGCDRRGAALNLLVIGDSFAPQRAQQKGMGRISNSELEITLEK
jgi:hypothetical protein